MAIKATLRYFPIRNGRLSVALDFYPPIRLPKTGKMGRIIRIGIYLYENPQTPEERSYNRSMKSQAELIRTKYMEKLNNEEYGLLDKEKQRMDLLPYFEKIACQSSSRMSTYKHFYRFTKGSCQVRELTRTLVRGFQQYLLTARQFHRPEKQICHNTVVTYVGHFAGMLLQAYKDELVDENLAFFLDDMEQEETEREFCLPSELLALSRTSCRYPVLRRAALFSCLTALRFSDVQALEWSNIVPTVDEDRFRMSLRTKKTKALVNMPLSEAALALCGPRGEGRVFKGLTRYLTNYPLQKWVEDAGIDKHITFHCFRHTFAVLQLAAGTPFEVVQEAMTHKSPMSTMTYVHIVNRSRLKLMDKIKIQVEPDVPGSAFASEPEKPAGKIIPLYPQIEKTWKK